MTQKQYKGFSIEIDQYPGPTNLFRFHIVYENTTIRGGAAYFEEGEAGAIAFCQGMIDKQMRLKEYD